MDIEIQDKETKSAEAVEHLGKRNGYSSDSLRIPVGLIPYFQKIIVEYKDGSKQAAIASCERQLAAIRQVNKVA